MLDLIDSVYPMGIENYELINNILDAVLTILTLALVGYIAMQFKFSKDELKRRTRIETLNYIDEFNNKLFLKYKTVCNNIMQYYEHKSNLLLNTLNLSQLVFFIYELEMIAERTERIPLDHEIIKDSLYRIIQATLYLYNSNDFKNHPNVNKKWLESEATKNLNKLYDQFNSN